MTTPTTNKPIVIIESPFAGSTPAERERNLRYVRAAIRDSLQRGEAPFASHALYTQPGVLDDEILQERELGIDAGFAFRQRAELTAVYLDLGVSPGMQAGMRHAWESNCPIELRYLPGWEVTPDRETPKVTGDLTKCWRCDGSGIVAGPNEYELERCGVCVSGMVTR